MARKPSYTTLSVLNAMARRPGEDHYGLELAHATDIATGTIYPILRRLERDGWVTSTWEDTDPSTLGRPRKRLYRLTGLGLREAQHHLHQARGHLAPTLGSFGTLGRLTVTLEGLR